MARLDISEHNESEGATAVEQFFEMSLDNVCVAGFDGYFKRVNPSWTRTLGWTAEELKARPVIEFVHPDDREGVLGGRTRLMSGEDMGPLTNRYRCKDGSYRWFEWRSVADVERERVYAVARDITEQKLAEEKLREAEAREERLRRQLIFADRMASVGTLAAGVAHEINNPLAYVIGNISMMVERLEGLEAAGAGKPLEGVDEMALDALEGAERIRKIVGGLKTFSRAEVERLDVIEVLPVIERAVDMTLNEIRHRARLVKELGEVPHVEADEARLGQVFINLLVNAAQAISEGHAADNEVRIVTSTDARGRAVIEVSDTGQGIADAALERVFDPFFTTKPIGVGTGLGLSICHNIVAGLGGEISVDSQEGQGATFRVVLPAAAPIDSDAVGSPASTHEEISGAAVLVIDDEPSVGRVIGRMLRDDHVTAVQTAREALALLESGEQFDVILSDLMMPEMSGMEFYGELVRRFPAAVEQVVFLSGGAFTPSARAFLDQVDNELLDKPFGHESLLALVRRYVER